MSPVDDDSCGRDRGVYGQVFECGVVSADHSLNHGVALIRAEFGLSGTGEVRVNVVLSFSFDIFLQVLCRVLDCRVEA